jgi:hypothetical protein
MEDKIRIERAVRQKNVKKQKPYILLQLYPLIKHQVTRSNYKFLCSCGRTSNSVRNKTQVNSYFRDSHYTVFFTSKMRRMENGIALDLIEPRGYTRGETQPLLSTFFYR